MKEGHDILCSLTIRKAVIGAKIDSIYLFLGYIAFEFNHMAPDYLGLFGHVIKRIRWLPRRQEAMKDVVACDKLRGVV